MNATTAKRGAAVLVLGAGNVGSHLLPLIARIPNVASIGIVDADVFDAGNARGQAILPGDVEKSKARVMAARLRRQAPTLAVAAYHARLETLPLGIFRVDLVFSCLDSRAARQHVNEIAFRAGGVPWIDAGVRADGLLARVTVYDPRVTDAPCLECAWGDADYAALEQVQPCHGDGRSPSTPPTNAPAALGALAAALQTLECAKRLAESADCLPAGSEVLIDAASHTHYRSASRRNVACRFDHEVWSLESLAAGPSASLAAVLARADLVAGSSVGIRLSVAGQPFLTQLACAACGTIRPLLRLVVALRRRDLRCAACGHLNVPRGFDIDHRLDPATLPVAALDRPLASFGVRSGDVVTLTHAGGVRRFALA